MVSLEGEGDTEGQAPCVRCATNQSANRQEQLEACDEYLVAAARTGRAVRERRQRIGAQRAATIPQADIRQESRGMAKRNAAGKLLGR